MVIILLLAAAVIVWLILRNNRKKRETADLSKPSAPPVQPYTPPVQPPRTPPAPPPYVPPASPTQVVPEEKRQETVYAFERVAQVRICPNCDGENALGRRNCRICGTVLTEGVVWS